MRLGQADPCAYADRAAPLTIGKPELCVRCAEIKAVFFGADAYFLVRVAEARVDTDGQEAFERTVITGHRWWTTGELRATSDKIVPAGLSDLMDSLLSEGVPAAPVRLPWGLRM